MTESELDKEVKRISAKLHGDCPPKEKCVITTTESGCTFTVQKPCLVAELDREHFTEPIAIACKWCGSKDVMKYGLRREVHEYICKKCGRKFIDKDSPLGKQSSIEQIGTSIS